VPGPEIRLRHGETLSLAIVNELDDMLASARFVKDHDASND